VTDGGGKKTRVGPDGNLFEYSDTLDDAKIDRHMVMKTGVRGSPFRPMTFKLPDGDLLEYEAGTPEWKARTHMAKVSGVGRQWKSQQELEDAQDADKLLKPFYEGVDLEEGAKALAGDGGELGRMVSDQVYRPLINESKQKAIDSWQSLDPVRFKRLYQARHPDKDIADDEDGILEFRNRALNAMRQDANAYLYDQLLAIEGTDALEGSTGLRALGITPRFTQDAVDSFGLEEPERKETQVTGWSGTGRSGTRFHIRRAPQNLIGSVADAMEDGEPSISPAENAMRQQQRATALESLKNWYRGNVYDPDSGRRMQQVQGGWQGVGMDMLDGSRIEKAIDQLVQHDILTSKMDAVPGFDAHRTRGLAARNARLQEERGLRAMQGQNALPYVQAARRGVRHIRQNNPDLIRWLSSPRDEETWRVAESMIAQRLVDAVGHGRLHKDAINYPAHVFKQLAERNTTEELHDLYAGVPQDQIQKRREYMIEMAKAFEAGDAYKGETLDREKFKRLRSLATKLEEGDIDYTTWVKSIVAISGAEDVIDEGEKEAGIGLSNILMGPLLYPTMMWDAVFGKDPVTGVMRGLTEEAGLEGDPYKQFMDSNLETMSMDNFAKIRQERYWSPAVTAQDIIAGQVMGLGMGVAKGIPEWARKGVVDTALGAMGVDLIKEPEHWGPERMKRYRNAVGENAEDIYSRAQAVREGAIPEKLIHLSKNSVTDMYDVYAGLVHIARQGLGADSETKRRVYEARLLQLKRKLGEKIGPLSRNEQMLSYMMANAEEYANYAASAGAFFEGMSSNLLPFTPVEVGVPEDWLTSPSGPGEDMMTLYDAAGSGDTVRRMMAEAREAGSPGMSNTFLARPVSSLAAALDGVRIVLRTPAAFGIAPKQRLAFQKLVARGDDLVSKVTLQAPFRATWAVAKPLYQFFVDKTVTGELSSQQLNRAAQSIPYEADVAGRNVRARLEAGDPTALQDVLEAIPDAVDRKVTLAKYIHGLFEGEAAATPRERIQIVQDMFGEEAGRMLFDQHVKSLSDADEVLMQTLDDGSVSTTPAAILKGVTDRGSDRVRGTIDGTDLDVTAVALADAMALEQELATLGNDAAVPHGRPVLHVSPADYAKQLRAIGEGIRTGDGIPEGLALPGLTEAQFLRYLERLEEAAANAEGQYIDWADTTNPAVQAARSAMSKWMGARWVDGAPVMESWIKEGDAGGTWMHEAVIKELADWNAKYDTILREEMAPNVDLSAPDVRRQLGGMLDQSVHRQPYVPDAAIPTPVAVQDFVRTLREKSRPQQFMNHAALERTKYAGTFAQWLAEGVIPVPAHTLRQLLESYPELITEMAADDALLGQVVDKYRKGDKAFTLKELQEGTIDPADYTARAQQAIGEAEVKPFVKRAMEGVEEARPAPIFIEGTDLAKSWYRDAQVDWKGRELEQAIYIAGGKKNAKRDRYRKRLLEAKYTIGEINDLRKILGKQLKDAYAEKKRLAAAGDPKGAEPMKIEGLERGRAPTAERKKLAEPGEVTPDIASIRTMTEFIKAGTKDGDFTGGHKVYNGRFYPGKYTMKDVDDILSGTDEAKKAKLMAESAAIKADVMQRYIEKSQDSSAGAEWVERTLRRDGTKAIDIGGAMKPFLYKMPPRVKATTPIVSGTTPLKTAQNTGPAIAADGTAMAKAGGEAMSKGIPKIQDKLEAANKADAAELSRVMDDALVQMSNKPKESLKIMRALEDDNIPGLASKVTMQTRRIKGRKVLEEQSGGWVEPENIPEDIRPTVPDGMTVSEMDFINRARTATSETIYDVIPSLPPFLSMRVDSFKNLVKAAIKDDAVRANINERLDSWMDIDQKVTTKSIFGKETTYVAGQSMADWFGLVPDSRKKGVKKKDLPKDLEMGDTYGTETKLRVRAYPRGGMNMFHADAQFIKAVTENQSFLRRLARGVKAAFTARSLPTFINNMMNNLVNEAIIDGDSTAILSVWKNNTIYNQYLDGNLSQSKDVGAFSAARAVDDVGMVDNTMATVELGPFEKALVETIPEAMHIGLSNAIERGYLKGTPLTDAAQSALKAGQKAAHVVFTKPGDLLKKGYSQSDVIFKVNNIYKHVRRAQARMQMLEVGDFYRFQVGEGLFSTLEIVKREGDTTTVKIDGRQLDIDGDIAYNRDVNLLAAREGAVMTNRKLFNYRDLTPYQMWRRKYMLDAFFSPFYTFAWKSMWLPGLKRGWMREIIGGDTKSTTNNLTIQKLAAQEDIGRIMRRQIALQALSAASKNTEDQSSMLEWMASFRVDKEMPGVIRWMAPGIVSIDSQWGIDPTESTGAALRQYAEVAKTVGGLFVNGPAPNEVHPLLVGENPGDVNELRGYMESGKLDLAKISPADRAAVLGDKYKGQQSISLKALKFMDDVPDERINRIRDEVREVFPANPSPWVDPLIIAGGNKGMMVDLIGELMGVISKTDNSWRSIRQPSDLPGLVRRMLPYVMGGRSTAAATDVLMGTIDPDSPFTSRQFGVEGEGKAQESQVKFAGRTLTGIGGYYKRLGLEKDGSIKREKSGSYWRGAWVVRKINQLRKEWKRQASVVSKAELAKLEKHDLASWKDARLDRVLRNKAIDYECDLLLKNLETEFRNYWKERQSSPTPKLTKIPDRPQRPEMFERTRDIPQEVQE
tara:strand:+ start:2131 stop:10032 length:7902 start_codon:yes stop_codon:yes gene_type:complete